MQVKRDGINFVVTFTHDDVNSVSTGTAIFAGTFPELAPVVAPLVGLMQVMDVIGGSNGRRTVRSYWRTIFSSLASYWRNSWRDR